MKKIILLIASFMLCTGTTLFANPYNCTGTSTNTTTNNITGTTTTITNSSVTDEVFNKKPASASFGLYCVDGLYDIRICANFDGTLYNHREYPIIQTTVSNGTITVTELPSGKNISSTPALIYSNSCIIDTHWVYPNSFLVRIKT